MCTATLEKIIETEPSIGWVFDELYISPKEHRWQRFVEKHGTTPKAYLINLVGFRARKEALRNQRAYRVVIDALWEAVL